MIGLIKKMINSDHREPLNNLMYIQDLVTSGQNGYVANSEENVQSLIKSPNVLLNTTAKNEYIKALGKYTKANLDFIKHIAKINVNSHSEIVNSSSAMQSVISSDIAMQAFLNLPMALGLALNSTTAFRMLLNSQIALKFLFSDISRVKEILNNTNALQAIIDNPISVQILVSSEYAMEYISKSSTILKKFLTTRLTAEKIAESQMALGKLKSSPFLQRVGGNSASVNGRMVILYASEGNTFSINYSRYIVNGATKSNDVRKLGEFMRIFPGNYATYIITDSESDDIVYYFNV